MNIPKNLIATVQFCPRGGQDGYYITESNLAKFAKTLGNKYIDLVIPLNTTQVLSKDCPDCHGANKADMTNATYWETDTGSHGWCCATCGMVIQWG